MQDPQHPAPASPEPEGQSTPPGASGATSAPAPSGVPGPRGPAALDSTDRRILEELARDARQSVYALAERVHVSRATAYERINRLRRDGVVLRYSTVVDPVRAGLGASAYVSLRLRQNTWPTLREKLRAMPEVQHIALVGGSFDVMLLVRAADTAGLRQVVFDRLQPLAEVVDTQTFLIFEDEDSR